ncbi:translesion error-prone DNA polymerase V autoproteolytic subunit [Pedobacter sp. MC2016-14]|uniref:LexA family protein n=1 Tax=Pedobacter sp. MC2016-14 TaxID=2897327 RepID=UPI001E424122|nr:translesion error-prone DNA polymerase V autoproteolytic subunit [Pedobacter sp. MC2016-14]MCD0489677.1 translesion error-prone DNA polymerase V autoproteolytic subunit [Pedobacter sp. MC2016-14]
MKEILMYQRSESNLLIPLVSTKIHAGFESPAADYEEEPIVLDAYLSKNPEAMFFARVAGDCMIGSGIFPNDLLAVDKSLNPTSGDVVVGIINNEFILRSYFCHEGKEYLMPDSNYYKPIERNSETEFQIWGVVPHTVLDQRRRKSERISRFEKRLRA